MKVNYFKPCLILIICTAPFFNARAEDAELRATFSNFTAYMQQNERIRHHRYQLELMQRTPINSTINTVIEGRFRTDTALYNQANAPYQSIDQQVRDDEMNEAEARQAYVDYISESFNLKIGLQQIDWSTTLSPRTSDVLTPIDLRHAGNGSSRDIVEPVFAASGNHLIGSGSIEWIIIPQGKANRLPKGANGYGYYEYLQGEHPEKTTISEKHIDRHMRETEFGVRWLVNQEGWDGSLLAFRGHQRSPAITIDSNINGTRHIEQSHPSANTFGASISKGNESTVIRFSYYFEPKRSAAIRPKQFFVSTPVAGQVQPLVNTVETKPYYEQRSLYGLGFDYVYSDDFKIYSEHFYSHVYRFETADDDDLRAHAFDDRTTQTIQSSFRVTNETWKKLMLSMQATLVGPDYGFSINPDIAYTWERYSFSLGGYFIASKSKESMFEAVKDSSQIYANLSYDLSFTHD